LRSTYSQIIEATGEAYDHAVLVIITYKNYPILSNSFKIGKV